MTNSVTQRLNSRLNFFTLFTCIISVGLDYLSYNILKKRRPPLCVHLFVHLFVHPLVEYAALTWNPYKYFSSIDNIERVQRRTYRFIPEIRYLTHRQKLRSLGLLSLEARRLSFQIISLFKIFKGFTHVHFHSFFTLLHSSRTRGHNYRIQ